MSSLPLATKHIIETYNPWWNNIEIKEGLPRTHYNLQIEKELTQKGVYFILGPRRAGKTTLIFQTIEHLLKEEKPQKILFLSLDNPVLADVNLVTYIQNSSFKYVFLDEIQYYPNWQQTLKSLFDNPSSRFKLICSGSASTLISDHKSFLTGRTHSIFVYPLNYDEFVYFNKSTNSKYSAESYLEKGGYPEYVLNTLPNYHNVLLQDVIEKDIVSNFKVDNPKQILQITTILAKQIGIKSTYTKISNALTISRSTTANYVGYLEKASIIIELQKYSESIKDRIYAPKKYYFYDTGIRNSLVGFVDIGSLAENAVLIKLMQTFPNAEIFYLTNTRGEEVDFIVIKQGNAILVEVKYVEYKEQAINKTNNLLTKDVYNLNITRRIIVTKNANGKHEQKGVKIDLIKLEDFLLEESI